MKNIISLILAAGKGTRLNCTDRPKVMLMIGEKPMIEYQVKTMEELGAERIILVIGFRGDLIKNYLKDRVEYVEQKEQLGTGHAVMVAKEKIKDFDGYILIAPGDAPFLTLEMLKSLVAKCEEKDLDGCILSVNLKDPLEYGRIVRNERSNVLKIVEKKDATTEELKITEINTGVYCFKAQALYENLDLITDNNVQKEYYLTDIIEIMDKKGLKIDTVITDDFEHTMGINRIEELEKARKLVR